MERSRLPYFGLAAMTIYIHMLAVLHSYLVRLYEECASGNEAPIYLTELPGSLRERERYVYYDWDRV